MTELEAVEWVRHYSETYIRVRSIKDDLFPNWEVVRVASAAAIGKNVSVLLDTSNGSTTITLAQVQWDAEHPKIGFFGYLGKQTLYVEKRPDRQWKRGLCRHTAKILFPFRTLTERFISGLTKKYGIILPDDDALLLSESDPRTFGLGMVRAMWNREFKSFTEAQKELLEGGALMLPLSEDFALSVAPDRAELLLWKYIFPIAEVKDSQITMLSASLKQEVLDFFSRNNNYNVRVQ